MRTTELANTLFALLILSMPGSALAETCPKTVIASGDILGGRQYRAQAAVPHLSVDGVFRQLRAIYAMSNIRIVSENPTVGLMQAEIAATAFEQARLISVLVREEGETGTVQMSYAIKAGELVNGGSIRKHLCSVLTQLVGRPPEGGKATANGVRPVKSRALAQQVDAAKANPAKLDTSFVGRLYQVSGLVLRVSIVSRGYAVWFEGLPMLTSNQPGADRPRLAVQCIVSKEHAEAAAGLTVTQRGTLVGRFARLNQDPRAPAVVLEDCRSPR